MGSRGFSLLAKSRGGNNLDTFGLGKAVNYSGKVPASSNLEKPSGNKITLKIASNREQDVIFQFKLTKDDNLSIRGYSPNQPEIKAHLVTSSANPSITRMTTSSNKTVKANATKLVKLMGMSESVNDSVLDNIVATLMNKKKGR